MEKYFHSLIRMEKSGLGAGIQRGALWFCSLFYGLIVSVRNRLFDLGWKRCHKAGVPVICVGNLTVGGTGKTPCVELIAGLLRQHGLRPAIVSRGYGSEAGRNDEALVLEKNLPDVPHLQGADRVQMAKIAVEELECDVLLLDDGFQHRRLRRELDIVLIDATNPWGYGFLLPRGLLREPLSGLRRAGMVIITRCNQAGPEHLRYIRQKAQQLAPGVSIVESIHSPTELINEDDETADLKIVAQQPVIAFCGIGNPKAFEKTLIDLGADIKGFRIFPDHHNYTREDIENLRRWAREQAKECIVVTTQKDLVKVRLSRIGERPLWALRIGLHVTGGRELLDLKLKEVIQ